MKKDWVWLGRCTKPHGIKGAFHFRLENSEDSVLDDGAEIFLVPSSKESELAREGELYRIEKIVFGHKVMAYLEGVDDRTRVEQLVPFDIHMDRENFPALDEQEDEFYHADLKGMEVYEAQTQRPLGKVERVYDNQAQAVLLIGRGFDAFEIPFVDAFVPKIDREKRKIWVVIPEYSS